MIKKFNKKRIFSAILVGVMAIASFSIPVWADEERKDKVHPGISPVSTSIELDPGQSYTGSFKVSNVGIDTFEYKTYATPFVVANETGTPDFDTSNKYTLIEKWIVLDKEGGKLAPGESDTITFTVNAPKDAPGGGQYAAIMIEADNEVGDKNNMQIEEVSRVGHTIYAQVNGEINECAKIINNTINTFMFEPPIVANSLVENCGNIHTKAEYTLKVYPFLSDNAIYTNEEEIETHTILPEMRRYNTVSWTKEDGAPSMGIFNVEQTVKVGKETSTVKKLVFIFPLWLVIIIILLIAAIIFWLVSRSRARKESRRSSANTSNPSAKSTNSDR